VLFCCIFPVRIDLNSSGLREQRSCDTFRGGLLRVSEIPIWERLKIHFFNEFNKKRWYFASRSARKPPFFLVFKSVNLVGKSDYTKT